MADTLVRSNVQVVDETSSTHKRVTIQLMAGSDVAKVVSRQGAVLHEKAGATTVVSTAARRWTINFGDGETWTVLASSGCNCGGR